MIVCIIGEGAWGTAVATLLAQNGHTVNLWCYHAEVAQDIQENHINSRYLPDIKLDKKIIPFTDLSEALCDVQWIFEAIPVKYMRSVMQQAQPCFDRKQIWVILSKGIEQETLLLPGQIIDEIFDITVNKVVFSGPSFARDLAQQDITAVTLATTDKRIGDELQVLLATDYFKGYVTDDVIGAQVGGALKNVITLAVGMLKGAGYADNAKAFIITRGLQEIITIAQALGGKCDTLYGLCGIGDLMLTAMGKRSRNLEVGQRLGEGDTLQMILDKTGYTPEGINTVQSVHKLAQKYNLTLPICTGVYQVIFEHRKLEALLAELI